MNKHEQELARIKAQIAECDASEQERIMAIARNFQRQIKADPPAGCLALAYVATDFSVQAVKHGIVPLAESLPKPEEFQAKISSVIDESKLGNELLLPIEANDRQATINEATVLLSRTLNLGWGGNINEELRSEIRLFVARNSVH